MPGSGEIIEYEKMPRTIEEVKILIKNFLRKLYNTLKNEYKEIFSEYEKIFSEYEKTFSEYEKTFSEYKEIFSEYKEILRYLQDIRKNLNNQQKSGVEAITSEEISKTLISKNTLKEGSFEENLKKIGDLIEKWIIFKRYIDTLKTDSQNVNEIKELLNTIAWMLLIIGDNKKS